MQKNIKCTLADVIENIRQTYLKSSEEDIMSDSNWCLYVRDDELLLSSECCVADLPIVNDETDEEIFPAFAVENGMDIMYLPELIQDVLISALHHKKNASDDELAEALNYYFENDCFKAF